MRFMLTTFCSVTQVADHPEAARAKGLAAAAEVAAS